MTDHPEVPDVTPPETPPEAAAVKKPFPWRLTFGLVSAVVVVLLAAWATLPFWRPSAPAIVQAWTAPLVPADQTTALSQNVDQLTGALSEIRTAQQALESRVGKLEAAPAPAAAPGGGDADLASRVDALQKLVNDLKSAPAASPAVAGASADALKALAGQVDDLGGKLKDLAAGSAQASAVLALADRVTSVEKAVQAIIARQDRAVAFLLAVGQLREAVNGGAPFADELKAARAIAPSDVSVDDAAGGFAAWADKGLPQREALAVHFDALAPDIIRNSAVADMAAQSGLWQKTLSRVATLLTITRSDGGAEGSGTPAIVARVSRLLQAGDVGAAVSEAKQLDGAAADTAKGWLADAEASLAAAKGLASLTAEAVARVGTAPSTPTKEGG